MPLRYGRPHVVPGLAADVRRAGRADRGDAARARRRPALAVAAPLPARAELLHAAARPGGPAARRLHRVAAQRHARRDHRRRAVRAARPGRDARRCRCSTSGSARPPRSPRCSWGWRPRWSRSWPRPWSGSVDGRCSARSTSAIAVLAFVALAVTSVPFPVVIAVAGLGGWLFLRGVRRRPHEPAHDDGPTGADLRRRAAPRGAEPATHAANPGDRRAALAGAGGRCRGRSPARAACTSTRACSSPAPRW